MCKPKMLGLFCKNKFGKKKKIYKYKYIKEKQIP